MEKSLTKLFFSCKKQAKYLCWSENTDIGIISRMQKHAFWMFGNFIFLSVTQIFLGIRISGDTAYLNVLVCMACIGACVYSVMRYNKLEKLRRCLEEQHVKSNMVEQGGVTNPNQR